MYFLSDSVSSKAFEALKESLPVPGDGGVEDEGGEGGDEVGHPESEEVD